LVGDANNLKLVNDTLGHLCGDKLLTTLADCTRKAAPPGSFIARTGGDEMVVLIPNSEEDSGETFVSSFNELLDGISDEEYGRPSMSWGYSVMRDESEEFNEVYQRADKEMYKNKVEAKSALPITFSGTFKN
jgi:diguanylate cyclase (GGDEF)-like protein